MAKDYYKVLGLSKDADDEAIKKAYKKAALLHHPDRNKGSEASSKKFKEVSEAFEVLSDKNKRTVYDQFGEEGLKGGGAPPPGAGGSGNPFSGFSGGFPGAAGGPGGTTFSFGGSGFPGAGGSSGFTASDPNDIFSAFFGGGRGGAASMFSGMNGMDMDEDASPFASFGGGGARPRAGQRQQQDDGEPLPDIVKPLACSLEELYTGTTKKMKISRKLASGQQESKVLEVHVNPGWKPGTKLRYKAAGNEQNVNGRIKTQDFVFVVEEKPHDRFTRDGDNLIYTLKVPLSEALSGPVNAASSKKSLTTLDKRIIQYSVPYPNPTTGGVTLKPDQLITVKGEGFPKKGGAKGDLQVKIEVVFPDRLNGDQASRIRAALSGN